MYDGRGCFDLLCFSPLSSRGPPLLPGLIAASVWITLRIGRPEIPDGMVRASPLTTPVVSVWSSPKGFPMAKTLCPTCSGRAERRQLSQQDKHALARMRPRAPARAGALWCAAGLVQGCRRVRERQTRPGDAMAVRAGLLRRGRESGKAEERLGGPAWRGPERPNWSGRSGLPRVSILSTATSLSMSAPTSAAGKTDWSENVTSSWDAPRTTWALVTMWPAVSQTRPEPEFCAREFLTHELTGHG